MLDRKKLAIILAVPIISIMLVPIQAQSEELVPMWIRQSMEYWINGQTSDNDFLNNITYLVDNEIISIPQMESLKNENMELKAKVEQMENSVVLSAGGIIQDDLSIDVHLNKNQYGPNDHIMIFGTVSDIVPEYEVGIVISDASGKILAIAKIPPNHDGSYGFVADNIKFKEFGQYTVNVYYGGKAFSHTTYSYNPIG